MLAQKSPALPGRSSYEERVGPAPQAEFIDRVDPLLRQSTPQGIIQPQMALDNSRRFDGSRVPRITDLN